jgi:anti-sigma factor RsiW
MTARERFECTQARAAIHATLDADLVDAALRQRLDAHLEHCSECREHAREHRQIQQGLRSLPTLELPDEVLDRVWAETTQAPARPAVRPRFLGLAAAAVLVVALAGTWLLREPVQEGPTEAELRQAAAEARMVLQLTSKALRQTEKTAFQDVLTEEVSEALRRAPIAWPERSAAQRRGS